MSGKAIFLDTNIIIYAYSVDNAEKRRIARSMIESEHAIISAQVLNEYCNTTRRKYPLMFDRVEETLRELSELVEIRDLTQSISQHAVRLTRRYGYSFYDCLIVASALAAECTVLVSEDMQDGMVIDERLRIANPFIPSS
jgi:predicted nucleic acid-binding protein